jgi:hypothetical protein
VFPCPPQPSPPQHCSIRCAAPRPCPLSSLPVGRGAAREPHAGAPAGGDRGRTGQAQPADTRRCGLRQSRCEALLLQVPALLPPRLLRSFSTHSWPRLAALTSASSPFQSPAAGQTPLADLQRWRVERLTLCAVRDLQLYRAAFTHKSALALHLRLHKVGGEEVARALWQRVVEMCRQASRSAGARVRHAAPRPPSSTLAEL